jgi:peptidoglycan/LPS O-acetylase OafA/YrhL
MVFYLAAPFVVGKRWPVIAALVLASLGIRTLVGLMMPGGLTYVWAYAFLPSEFVFFLLGICSYRVYRLVRETEWARPAGYAFLLLYLLVFLTANHLPVRTGPLLVFYSVFLALGIPLLFCAFKQSALDRAIGDLSYVVYVTHVIAFKLAAMLIPQPSVALAFSMLAFVSLLFYFVIEVPVEKYRSRMHRKGHSKDQADVSSDEPRPSLLRARVSTAGD